MNTMNVKFLDNKKHKRFTYSAFIPIGLMFWSISKPKEIGFEYRHLMQKKKKSYDRQKISNEQNDAWRKYNVLFVHSEYHNTEKAFRLIDKSLDGRLGHRWWRLICFRNNTYLWTIIKIVYDMHFFLFIRK